MIPLHSSRTELDYDGGATSFELVLFCAKDELNQQLDHGLGQKRDGHERLENSCIVSKQLKGKGPFTFSTRGMSTRIPGLLL